MRQSDFESLWLVQFWVLIQLESLKKTAILVTQEGLKWPHVIKSVLVYETG